MTTDSVFLNLRSRSHAPRTGAGRRLSSLGICVVGLALTILLFGPTVAVASDPPAFDTPVPAGFDTVVMLAEDEIDLKKEIVIVSGDLIGNGQDSEIDIDKDSETPIGFSVKAAGITLKSGVVTASDFSCNDLDDDTGTVTCLPLALPVFSTLPPFLAASPGNADVDIAKDESLILAPGAYAKLEMKKNSTLTLTGGIYDFEEFKVEKDSFVLFQAPTILRIGEDLDVKKLVFFGPDATVANPPTAADLRVYIDDGDASFDQGTQVHANLYLRDGEVDLKKGITFVGAILATEISVDQGSTIALDSAFRNLAPTPQDDAITLLEGGAATTLVGGGSSLLDNDTDPNNDGLFVTIAPVTAPTNGAVVLQADGSFIYTHDSSETIADSFVYEVCDDGVAPGPLCSNATVIISITPVNDPPVPVPDSFTVDEGGTATVLHGGAVSLLVNDTDAEGNNLSLSAAPVFGPSNGAVTLNADGTFSYTHDGSETTSDSFGYEVCDDGTDTPGPLCSSAGVVTITVNPVNDAPVATADTFTVDEGGTATELDGAVLSFLANDTDIENNNLTATTTPVSGPTNGTVTINSDGTFSYTHDGSETTSDSFQYQVCDDGVPSECDTGLVTITVNPVNDDPVANPQTLTTEFPITITLTGTDAEGDALAFTVVGGPDLGSLGPVTSTGNFSATVDYTLPASPDEDDVFDSFTFQVDDGNGGLDTALVSINLIPPNSPPVTGADTIRTTQGGTATTLINGATSLLANDFDPEGGTLSVSATPVSGPSDGTVTLNTDGTFSYTNANSGATTDAFVYQVCDDGTPIACANGQVSIQVFSPTIDVTLTFAGDGGGTVTSSPAGLSCTADCTATIASPDRIVMTATPATGSAFAGFGGDADCSDGELVPDGNKTCTVTFNAIPPPPTGFFNLTVSKAGTGGGTVTTNPAGISCGATCTSIFPAFQRVAMTPVPDPGSEFVNWNGTTDCLDGDVIRLPGEDASCVAVFDLVVVPPSVDTLTVVVNGQGAVSMSPSGTVCGADSTCSVDFGTGTVVTLGARASGGSFVGWSGDPQCVGTSPLLSVTVGAAVTCTATFNP